MVDSVQAVRDYVVDKIQDQVDNHEDERERILAVARDAYLAFINERDMEDDTKVSAMSSDDRRDCRDSMGQAVANELRAIIEAELDPNSFVGLLVFDVLDLGDRKQAEALGECWEDDI